MAPIMTAVNPPAAPPAAAQGELRQLIADMESLYSRLQARGLCQPLRIELLAAMEDLDAEEDRS